MRPSRLAHAAGIALVVGATLWTGLAQAKDYCCVCRGQSAGKTIYADDDMSASFDCSMACKRPTKAKAGACEGPPAATPAPAPAPAPAATPATAAPAGRVLLFTTDDCSGEPAAVTQSTGRLTGALAGMHSFSVESGAPASAFEKADFGGQRNAPVGPGLCLSPGWEIAGIRIGAQ
jgi:hypothetical protein